MKTCKVKNRSASVIVYNIPADGSYPSISRRFSPGESKEVDIFELERLSNQPGGMNILTRFLQLQDMDTINSFNMRVEPEYHMSEQDVVDLITKGSLDAFLDALDFAPDGVKDLIKSLSIKIPLVDIQKREALKKKTGMDIEAILKNIAAEKEEDKPENITDETPKRRVAVADAAPARRTAVPKYNVVTPKEEGATAE